MNELDKDRLQTEVLTKIREVKMHAFHVTPETGKINFLSKFLNFNEKNKTESKKRVLLCEDDKLISKLLTRHLENNGFEVVSTVSPIFYTSKESLESFDFIITDNRMPYMFGTQFVEFVEQELKLNVPMYLHSGDCDLKEQYSLSNVLKGIFVKGGGFDLLVSQIKKDLELSSNQFKKA